MESFKSELKINFRNKLCHNQLFKEEAKNSGAMTYNVLQISLTNYAFFRKIT